MSDPEEAGKYRVENQQAVQGQVVGDYATVHIYTTPPPSTPPPASLEPIWNIPYLRNPFFIGREDLLSRLHTQLHAGQATALSQPQAMSGLGGVGKTQVAVEYAYRYARDYQAVFWTRADSREALVSSFVELAILLNLPERDERDQSITAAAVQRWLRAHTQWLLILDNADDLSFLPDFLSPIGAGHVVLTTRAQAFGGLAGRIEVNIMDQETGMKLLLRRAGVLPLDAPLTQAAEKDRSITAEICQELGGLPLALDQAGAYIEETSCTLSDYLQLYRTRRIEILKRRGGLLRDHPDPVATTWSLSLTAIEQRHGDAAVDLLHICAFCAPDAIPEELLRQGSLCLGPALSACASDPFAWNTVLATVGAYSLLQRNSAEKILSIHRLVQAVLQDAMSEPEQEQWRERLIAALNVVFPEVEATTWRQCERLLPHALICASQTQSWKHMNLDLASVLFKTANYLMDRAQYTEAEPLFWRSSYIREQALGHEHPLVAYPLNSLANLCREQGKYTEAEPLFRRALHIREQALGHEHSDVATSLNDLAGLYRKQGRYAEAEPLFRRALRIREQEFGPEHPDVARSLNGLADLCRKQGKHNEAELLFQRALRIREQQLGPEHPEVAFTLHGLANLYQDRGDYAEAEPLYLRSLRIREQQLGPEHPLVADPLYGLARLYQKQEKYIQAESLYLRALRIEEQRLGPAHPSAWAIRMDFVSLLRTMGRDGEATNIEESS